jgi:hypothetical protein
MVAGMLIAVGGRDAPPPSGVAMPLQEDLSMAEGNAATSPQVPALSATATTSRMATEAAYTGPQAGGNARSLAMALCAKRGLSAQSRACCLQPRWLEYSL